ncbi:MAG: sensor histidine kinase [Gemmobacter sp.]
MIAPASIRGRLLAWLFLSSAVIGGLALLDTRAEALRTSQAISDRILAGSALAIAERVTVSTDGGLDVDIPYAALEMLASTAQDQVFYRVDSPAGILTGYADLPRVPGAAPGTTVFAGFVTRGVEVRAATLTRVLSTGEGDLAFSVTVAESTRARAALARALLTRSALRMTLLATAAAVVSWIAVTLALRPLNRLGQGLAARAPADLTPIRADVPREVEGLIEAINGFMARLDATVSALKTFSGSANHQIRTPLTTARMQLAMASRGGDPAVISAALDKADAALIRAERVLAQLLLLAQVEAAGAQPARSRLDLTDIARQLVSERIPEAACDLGFEGDLPAFAMAEATLVQELLHNLIDNALTHAGPDPTVTVKVTPGTTGAELAVEDTGPPLSDAQLTTIRRALEGPQVARTARASAHGLGLLIVRDIAEAFDARITVQTGPEGRGLRVMVRFPPAA